MCLGIPGKILEVEDTEPRMGRGSFGGIVKNVCLAYTPEAAVGDYVIVHVGFSISIVNAAEAERVFSYLDEMGAMEDDEIRR